MPKPVSRRSNIYFRNLAFLKRDELCLFLHRLRLEPSTQNPGDSNNGAQRSPQPGASPRSSWLGEGWR
ncbi:hypothetical protein I7I50_04847 [Histoplasma capsulatum G186AR]|uniref:Uncharacterized protein n=1 Tax=Ajellomyces capsulatus TaxID=5037 RepID=A0A8H7ZAC7_AJECA|nr:hypothetical protein I7I52_03105 [Histoplasma capsulatum]QSS75651.1 hypothetical protein I7I50_04847 [Histoplasma capsulatum G186AR]